MELPLAGGSGGTRMGCQHWILYNRDTKQSTLFSCNSPRCNRGECQECWARKRIAIAQNLIDRYHLTRFFTLTISRKYSIEISWQNISAWWSVFRKRMAREALDYGIKLQFFCILECHNDGYPHLHGFWNIHVDQSDLSRIWSECAPGHIVDVRTVDSGTHAGEYLGIEVGRYIGKKQAVDAGRMVKKHKRTMWRSVGMKTDYEIHKKLFDMLKGVDYTNPWVLDKRPIPVVLEKDYETKREGHDMESSCSPIPEGCTEESIPNVETEKPAYECCESEAVTSSEVEDQRTDKERKGKIRWLNVEVKHLRVLRDSEIEYSLSCPSVDSYRRITGLWLQGCPFSRL